MRSTQFEDYSHKTYDQLTLLERLHNLKEARECVGSPRFQLRNAAALESAAEQARFIYLDDEAHAGLLRMAEHLREQAKGMTWLRAIMGH